MQAEVPEPDALPLEFLNLPQASMETIDEPQIQHVEQVFMIMSDNHPRSKLRQSLRSWQNHVNAPPSSARNDDDVSMCRARLRRFVDKVEQPKSSMVVQSPETEVALFASHGSYGVVDLGATKTVIGSHKVSELIDSLDPALRKQISRCPCAITFRFGNQGVLQSKQALVVPIQGLLLKIAIVPGATPFLLSNTLLRALGAVIDTGRKVLISKRTSREVPLVLTEKGLFLLDLNELAHQPDAQPEFSKVAETHTVTSVKPPDQISSAESVKNSVADIQRSCGSENQDQPLVKTRSVTAAVNHASESVSKTADTHVDKQHTRSESPISGNSLVRSSRHVSFQTSPEGAGTYGSSQERLHAVGNDRPGKVDHRLREAAEGQDLPSSL